MAHKHATEIDVARKVRELYLTAEGMRAANIAEWLDGRSDVVLADAFHVAPGQVTALRSRLRRVKDSKAAVQSARGQ